MRDAGKVEIDSMEEKVVVTATGGFHFYQVLKRLTVCSTVTARWTVEEERPGDSPRLIYTFITDYSGSRSHIWEPIGEERWRTANRLVVKAKNLDDHMDGISCYATIESEDFTSAR